MMARRKIAATDNSGQVSQFESPDLGIPQGGSMSCTLYLTWVVDLVDSFLPDTSNFSIQFADDLNIKTTSSKSAEDMLEKQKEIADKIQTWCDTNDV